MTEEEQKEETKEEQRPEQTSEKPSEQTSEKPSEKPSEQTSEKPSEKKADEDDNVIFVGIKPFMNYVTGVVMQFQNKGQKIVLVSARGKFVSKAVDVVEVARRTFLKDENIKVTDIQISSEQFENKEGKRIYVSSIEIKLTKEDKI